MSNVPVAPSRVAPPSSTCMDSKRIWAPLVLVLATIILFSFDRSAMKKDIESDKRNAALVTQLDDRAPPPAGNQRQIGSMFRVQRGKKSLSAAQAKDFQTLWASRMYERRVPFIHGFRWITEDPAKENFFLKDKSKIAQVRLLQQRLKEAAQPEGSLFSGVLMIANGEGKCALARFLPSGMRGDDRLPSPIFSYIRGAAAQLKTFTIFHVGVEDNDPWYHVRFQPGSALANHTLRLTQDFPNLFWVHWNPTLLDDSKGAIGPRVVPIPHFHAVQQDEALKAPEYANRTRGVAWRGTTTGWTRPYNTSDRWRMVAAFLNKPNGSSNVKFYSRCQGVTADDVPEEMMGGTLPRPLFVRYQVTLDADGNANAWESLRWKLQAGSTVVKARSKLFIQWYYPLLQSGVHLLDVDLDTDDIAEAALKLKDSPTAAAAMGKNALTFAQEHLVMSRAATATHNIILNAREFAENPVYRNADWRIRPTTKVFQEQVLVEVVESKFDPVADAELQASEEKRHHKRYSTWKGVPVVVPDTRNRVNRFKRPNVSSESREARLLADPNFLTPEQAGKVKEILKRFREGVALPGNYFSGILFVSNGKGSAKRLLITDTFRGSDRLPSPLTGALLEGAKQVSSFKVFHFGLEDNDPWYHVRMDPTSALAKYTQALTRDFEDLYWLHWNPTLVVESKGQIGERVIPIPHFHATQRNEVVVAPKYANRTRGVAWRGTTTGWARPYNTSDRWRMVAAFLNKPNGSSNVKFYSRCQGVTADDVPEEMMGATLPRERFASYQVTLDADGNANAWESLRWKLQAGSTVVKARSKLFIQWYYPLLQSGVHLLNVDLDSEDIAEVALQLADDAPRAESIAQNARSFATMHLRTKVVYGVASQIVASVSDYGPNGTYWNRDWRIRPQR